MGCHMNKSKLKCHYCSILKVLNFVLKVSYNMFTCIQGQKTFFHFLIIYLLKETENSLFEESLSLNSFL